MMVPCPEGGQWFLVEDIQHLFGHTSHQRTYESLRNTNKTKKRLHEVIDKIVDDQYKNG